MKRSKAVAELVRLYSRYSTEPGFSWTLLRLHAISNSRNSGLVRFWYPKQKDPPQPELSGNNPDHCPQTIEKIGAPDRIRTCDLCLRRAKDKGFRAFQHFPAYSKNPLNNHLFCIGIPRDALQFSSRCLLCAYFLKASKHRFEVSNAKCQAHQDRRGQRQSRSRR
jgi:hypothetical protein